LQTLYDDVFDKFLVEKADGVLNKYEISIKKGEAQLLLRVD